MLPSEARHSGENGPQKPASPYTPVSIENLPDAPTAPQKVKFFTARDTFIAGSSLEDISAILFDAWAARLFGDIEDIDRAAWTLADRLYAINAALDQQQERRANGQIYVRLDRVSDGRYQLTLIEPAMPEEQA